MQSSRQERLFVCFTISGACSLVYEVVWLRLAMACFGVTTPMVSIVLSVFMAGLALWSWLGGALARRLGGAREALRVYGWTELAIGLSAVLVPWGLRAGHGLLVTSSAGFSSTAHYLAAGGVITALLLPFCTAMGATLPLGVAVVRGEQRGEGGRAFSFLYLANVVGATVGTLASALVLIETLGFKRTLLVAAAGNGVIVLLALQLAAGAPRGAAAPLAPQVRGGGERGLPWLLFATGLASMGMEVVWTRLFTPFLGTLVYAFAKMLACYLVATFLGTMAYRRWAGAMREKGRADTVLDVAWSASLVLALLPLATTDPRSLPRFAIGTGDVILLLGIAPFCAVLGFITPMLVDRFSGGDPARAGRAYAANVLGCIVGPLLAGFGLLPVLSERWSLAVLASPLLAAALGGAWSNASRAQGAGRRRLALPGVVLAGALGVALVLGTHDYASRLWPRVERRDSTATVIATGFAFQKKLLVNGYSMTSLTPITKVMVHFPLALLGRRPERVAVLCFGMGTTFRSSLSWGVPTVAVELTPSVPELFGYFHPDAEQVLQRPGAQVVIDDARRYLERTRERFDVITVDPPPPVAAAGSSLLYSREFAALAHARLAPDGVLQQWLPRGDPIVVAGVLRALTASFGRVRVFRSHEGWGYHFLASDRDLGHPAPAVLAARLPEAARLDFVEWGPFADARSFFAAVLAREINPAVLLRESGPSPVLTDDRPLNEYFLLRDGFMAAE